jgi:quercetin dioxygenase-like cupin family protein
MISVSLLFGLLLTLSAGMYAQDPLKVAPNVSKEILLENDQVRVLYVEYEPGEITPWHSHPNHVVYALTDGKIEITDKDKLANVIELKANTAVFMPAVTHMVKNIGSTTLKIVVTEMKPTK